VLLDTIQKRIYVGNCIRVGHVQVEGLAGKRISEGTLLLKFSLKETEQ